MKISSPYEFNLPNGMTCRTGSISSEDAAHLIDRHNGVILPEHTNPYYESKVYLLDDKRVVQIFLGPDAILYEPYEGFLAYEQEHSRHKKLPAYPRRALQRLPGQQVVRYQQWRGEAAQQLLADLPASSLYSGHRTLDDGGLLYFEGRDFAQRYESEADWLALKEFERSSFAKKQPPPGQYLYLCGLNPYGEDFPHHATSLAGQLPRILDAPVHLFDGSPQKLDAIEKHFYKHVITPEFSDAALMPLLAYIGQSYIKTRGGEWVMHYADSMDTWVPDVRQADNLLKMLYHALEIIFDPLEYEGIYIPLPSVFNHTQANPMDC